MDLVIDCGFKMHRYDRARLLGVDTPEMRGEERPQGQRSRAWVVQWFDDAEGEWPLIVKTEKKPDHFGRLLVTIWRVSDGACLNEDLIENDMAEVYR